LNVRPQIFQPTAAMGNCIKVVLKKIEKCFGGGKILAKDFGIFMTWEVTLFGPKFCP
jgi:hypothetical protein